jgi:von Willebrand factor type A domain
MFRLGLAFLFLSAGAQLLHAANGNCSERTAIVGARNRDTKGVPAELTAKVNGKPVQIVETARPATTRVVIVLDASGRMSSKWERAVDIAREIIHESSSSTQFAVVMFANSVFKTIGFGKTSSRHFKRTWQPHGSPGRAARIA